MNIDEAVELARRCLDVGGADYNECDLNTLARAVLAMAAVVERARAVVVASHAYWNDDGPSTAVEDATDRIAVAVAALDAEARRG